MAAPDYGQTTWSPVTAPNSPRSGFSAFTRFTWVKSEPAVTFSVPPCPFTAFSSLPGSAVASAFADRSQRGS